MLVVVTDHFGVLDIQVIRWDILSFFFFFSVFAKKTTQIFFILKRAYLNGFWYGVPA